VSLCGDLTLIREPLLLTLSAYVPLTKTTHLTTSSSNVEINQPSRGMSGQTRAMWWDSEKSLRVLEDKSGSRLHGRTKGPQVHSEGFCAGLSAPRLEGTIALRTVQGS
jgi:hypothetical protein